MISILAALASVVAAGAWLRWAVVPVRVAYDLGRQVERAYAAGGAPSGRRQ